LAEVEAMEVVAVVTVEEDTAVAVWAMEVEDTVV
jgi:hypothetical protein